MRYGILDFGFWIADCESTAASTVGGRGGVCASRAPTYNPKFKIQNPKSKMAVWLLMIAAFAGAARSEEPCATCGETPFPDAVAFLNSQGFPPNSFKVLMAWNETAPADLTQVVYGYHVLPMDGSPAFDLYSDVSGQFIDEARLAKLGIKPKNWDLRPREAPSRRRFGAAWMQALCQFQGFLKVSIFHRHGTKRDQGRQVFLWFSWRL